MKTLKENNPCYIHGMPLLLSLLWDCGLCKTEEGITHWSKKEMIGEK